MPKMGIIMGPSGLGITHIFQEKYEWGHGQTLKKEMQLDCWHCLHLRPLSAFNVFQDRAGEPSI
jgi:hypothetical protein